ncbi:MAG: alpha/beta hydrolase [Acidobacteria bacterium]|nr:alpha/beta hydrolase [Acidobacteriota bacterium]MCA1637412.1 alpha/beta hydrolase [Acidobacteriota bacterium]
MSFVKIGNFKIGYTEKGKVNGKTPIVFLHGVGSDKSVWNEQIDFFSASRRAIAFDYAGYGESDLPEKKLTREEISAFVLKAMDDLEVEIADVVGLSMGGVIALEMFRQTKKRIHSLVLANTFAKHPNGVEVVERSQKFIENHSMLDFAEQRVELLLAPQTSQAIRSEVVESMSRIDKSTYDWASTAVWMADYTDLLSEINIPTLVIGSELDVPTPSELSKELAEKIPKAKLAIIENAGHLSNLDQPQIFNSLIVKFIEGK